MRAFRISAVAFIACMAVTLAASGVSPSRAQTATPAAASLALPPDATVGGLGLADWVVRSQQWLLSFPSAINPAFDLTGERCAYGQSGPVFFLLQSPADRSVRNHPAWRPRFTGRAESTRPVNIGRRQPTRQVRRRAWPRRSRSGAPPRSVGT